MVRGWCGLLAGSDAGGLAAAAGDAAWRGGEERLGDLVRELASEAVGDALVTLRMRTSMSKAPCLLIKRN